MKRIYLDHNIFIKCLEDSSFIDSLCDYYNKDILVFYYGPAHMEEIYRVESDINSPYRNDMKKLRKIIEQITQCNEILPANDGLKFVKEPTRFHYDRIKKYDTTELIAYSSIEKYGIDHDHYKKMLEMDKNNRQISNLSFSDIWNHSVIQAIINEFNEKKDKVIFAYNNSMDMLISALICGQMRILPEDFCIKKDNYKLVLKQSFDQLEYTIEFLMRVLNYCGYNAEKTKRTAISGTHDVTHCIYATVTDCIITMDQRFFKKCKAIYYYLGVDTRVVYCNNIEEIKDVIKQLYNEGMNEMKILSHT